jgi:hypothetical protein
MDIVKQVVVPPLQSSSRLTTIPRIEIMAELEKIRPARIGKDDS